MSDLTNSQTRLERSHRHAEDTVDYDDAQRSLLGCGGNAAWHHSALLRRGTTLGIWRDCALDLTDTSPGNAENIATRSFRIGKAPAGGPSVGPADDFRVYDRALLESEIQAQATTPWTGQPPCPLYSLW